MNDDNTRHLRYTDDDVTRTAGAGTSTASWDDDAPDVRRDHGRSRWLVPLVVLLAGVASFVVVSLVLRNRHDPAPAGAPTVAASSPAASSPDASSGSSQTSSSGASSSTADKATFPAEAANTCMDDDKEVTNPEGADVRMKAGSETSCAFLSSARSEVITHLATDPQARQFTVKPYSVPLKKYIPLTCTRSQALTYCSGGTSARLWVRNP